MPGRSRYTSDQVCDALKQTHGTVYLAAEILGCTPRTVNRLILKFKDAEAAIADARGRRVDMAELKLDAAVNRDEAWAIQMVLRTQGRDRGYGDHQEIETTATINVNDTREKVDDKIDKIRQRWVETAMRNMSPERAG